MLNIGLPELILILVVALLVFGPNRLPELARSLGKGLAEFRRASADLRSQFMEPPPEPPRPAPAATTSALPAEATASPPAGAPPAEAAASRAEGKPPADAPGAAAEKPSPAPVG